MKGNTYQGDEFEKNISLLYYSPLGSYLRSVVYVCWPAKTSVSPRSCSEV